MSKNYKENNDISSEYLEKMLYKLHSSAESNGGEHLREAKVFLGEIDDGEQEDIKINKKILSFLKKEGIISNFEIAEDSFNEETPILQESKEHIGQDIETLQAMTLSIPILVAYCKYNPSKVKDYLKKLWKPKADSNKKLIERFILLEKTVRAFFEKGADHEKQTNLEKIYKKLCEEIQALIKVVWISPYPYCKFFEDYNNPFTSLFSAEKEMIENKQRLGNILGNLKHLYGQAAALKEVLELEEQKILIETELEKLVNLQENKKDIEAKLRFDDKKSILYFQEREILISRNRDTNPHYLLLTLFKDKGRVWNFDEIAEDWKDEYSKKSWRRYYTTCYTVNKKVAIKTTIDDFLIVANKTVAINHKYL